MKPYRFARRSFLAGTFALEILLRNMEATAEGATSPARMLLTPFPVDTYRQSYLPQGGQTDFTSSPILQPSQSLFNGAHQTGTSADASLYQFLVTINACYNQNTADTLTTLKNAKEGLGTSVLDHTIVPYSTEFGDPSHDRGPKASLLFGGKALGMKGGQFLDFESNVRPQVDVWLMVAQTLLQNDDPLGVLPTSEKFNRTGAGPVKGSWAKPT